MHIQHLTNLIVLSLYYEKAKVNYPEIRKFIFHSNLSYFYLLTENYEKAKKNVELALRIKPDDWYSYINLGLIYNELKEHRNAIDCYNKAIENELNQDAKTLARIFKARSLHLLKVDPEEYIIAYLEANGEKDKSQAHIKVISENSMHFAKLIDLTAEKLRRVNTYGLDKYIGWFENCSFELKST